ncbi:hypothetical protein [Thermogymnomonas acidicola]|uniref:hypothetical protein n=1 Tax=Thermogymnomonas acidicola TaxID=399579 RepID=UPI001494C6C4|nr:hypothetical protein [Thermogymnomonas acidicola]
MFTTTSIDGSPRPPLNLRYLLASDVRAPSPATAREMPVSTVSESLATVGNLSREERNPMPSSKDLKNLEA